MKNREKYKFLDSDEQINKWWNNLSEYDRIDVGGEAVRYSLMSANFKWDVQNDYDKLKKSQKLKVNNIYSRRNDEYTIFTGVKFNI